MRHLTCAVAIFVAAVLLSPTHAVAGVTSYADAATIKLGEGAWSWFENPRAFVTGGGCELVASAAAGPMPIGWVNVESNYLQTSAGNPTLRTTVTMDTTLTHDDHTSGSLLKLANGEILTAWSGHAQDRKVRVAVRSGAARKWTRLPGFTSGGLQTYNNLFQLADGTVLNFTRRNPQSSPRLYRSLDNGRHWSHVGELLRFTGDPRATHGPYVQYVQSGDRIYFTTTLGHPQFLGNRGRDSPIYAGYLEGSAVHRSDGSVAGAVGRGVEADELTLVYQPIAGHSAWTSGLKLDSVGAPVAVFSIRDRAVPGASPLAIRYAQARFSAGVWTVHDVAPGGRSIYGNQSHYSGNITGDPGNANHVVISSSVHPATNADLGQFDLFDGHTTDGVTWTWEQLTNTPKKDDLRPFLTNQSVSAMQALVWFNGRYDSYTNYDTAVRYRVLNPNGVVCP